MSHVGLLVALSIGVAIFCWVIFAMLFMSSGRGTVRGSRFKLPWQRRNDPTPPDEENVTTVTEFLRPGQEPHPPVYCVEDLEIPPPAYQPANQDRRPSVQELRNLNIRLRELKRERTTSSDSYDSAIRQDEIRHLTEWIRKREALSRTTPAVRVVSNGVDDDEDYRPRSHRHRHIVQRETGWVGIGLPREVRPRLDEIENTLVVRRNSEPPRQPLMVADTALRQQRNSC